MAARMFKTLLSLLFIVLVSSFSPAARSQAGFLAYRSLDYGNLAQADGDTIYISSANSGTAGGIAFTKEDILAFDPTSGSWSMFLDGSDVGLSSGSLDAFDLQPDGSILLSLAVPANVPGLGWVAETDIVRFIPASLGENTQGSFEWYLDGSDVGLDANSENIDALGFTPDGSLVISTIGSSDATGASTNDEDLLLFAAVQLGATSSGTWSLYFDGSDVGLSTTSDEDVNGTWIDPASGQIYLTTLGVFAVNGSEGDGADIFVCTPGSLGSSTTCTYGPGLYWDGSNNGFAGQVVDGIDIVRTGGGEPTPTNTQVVTATATPLSPTLTPTPTSTSLPPSSTATATGASTATPTFTPSPLPATSTPTLTSTPTSGVTFTPTPTSTSALPGSGDRIYLTTTNSGSVAGISYADEDILAFDTRTGTWSLYFDGSDAGLSSLDISAFDLLPDGSLLISLAAPGNIPGLGLVDDSDIVRFVPFTLGNATDGSYEWYLDGSDVGLDDKGEPIDAMAFSQDGKLLVSTIGPATVPGVTANDEDLLAFTPSQLGATSSGSWALYFDGSDVGLNSSSSEDINAAWIDASGSKIYLSTLGAFTVNGSAGDGSDIFICTTSALGSTTACTFGPGLYFDGSANGLAGQVVDGIDIVKAAAQPTPTPTACPSGPVRIMPLGDSITRGEGSTSLNGYRRRLYLALNANGYSVNFVGGLQNGLTDFDVDHEGHGGWHAEGGTEGGIALYIYNWLAANPADVVLLHIGTNDISNGDQNVADVVHILDEIDRYDPKITVVLAGIINRSTYSPATTQYNANVKAMAEARIANGDRIVLVDMENALAYPGDMADNVHPNDSGYIKMAGKWLEALQGFLPRCR